MANSTTKKRTCSYVSDASKSTNELMIEQLDNGDFVLRIEDGGASVETIEKSDSVYGTINTLRDDLGCEPDDALVIRPGDDGAWLVSRSDDSSACPAVMFDSSSDAASQVERLFRVIDEETLADLDAEIASEHLSAALGKSDDSTGGRDLDVLVRGPAQQNNRGMSRVGLSVEDMIDALRDIEKVIDGKFGDLGTTYALSDRVASVLEAARGRKP